MPRSSISPASNPSHRLLVIAIGAGLSVAAAAGPAVAQSMPPTVERLPAGHALATATANGSRSGPSGPVAAATAATPVDLDPVKVTATTTDLLASPKFTAPLLDTTQTVQIIGADLIDQQGATTLTEALRNSPGVGTFYAGENGSTTTGDAIRMRGFDTSGSIFVDGVRDLGSISRDIFNIEQIEVTKGPAGTDNGRTAPSGSINLVTKQPHLGDHLGAEASFGSGPQRRLSADWNHTLTPNMALRLNVMDQRSGVPGRDAIENNRWGIAPTIAFGLDTDTRVYLDYLHVSQDNVPDGGVPTIGLPGYSSPDPTRPQIGLAPPVDSSHFYGTDADHGRADVDMFTARIEHEISDHVALRNTTRWGRTTQDYLLTSFMGSADRLHTPDLNDRSTWTIARSIPTFKDQAHRIVTNQTNVTAHFDTGAIGHSLSTGLELTREQLHTTDVDSLDASSWPAANLYHPDPHVTGLVWGETGARSEGTTDTVAAYLFDTLTLNAHWQVNAGLRLGHYRTRFNSTLVCGSSWRAPACGDLPAASVVPGVDASVSGYLPNWKLGVLYKPRDNGSVYINVAVAMQPPGGANLELSASDRSPDNPAFEPQRARTTELGTKWNLLGEHLLLTAAVYRTEVSNEITQDPVDQLYYQVGKKRVQGIELGASGNLTRNWSLHAGYTIMDASVIKGSHVAEDGSDGLPYTPESAFTAWSTYRLPGNLVLGGGVRTSGPMKRGTDGAIGTPTSTRSWWVADAMLSYPLTRHVDLRLNLYNLFGQDYVAAINKSGYRYRPGKPRSAMLTARVSF